LKWRINFLRAWAINSDNSLSSKSNSSEYFASRNYSISAMESEQKLVFQPNTAFRISGIYKFSTKENVIGFQKADINTQAVELRYNESERGSLSGRFDLIRIRYNDAENSSVAYEMLNGLSRGQNYTWELGYQRNLNNNLQVSITYSGRKSATSSIVHLGGAQVRAYF
jgi:hypothetical protein